MPPVACEPELKNRYTPTAAKTNTTTPAIFSTPADCCNVPIRTSANAISIRANSTVYAAGSRSVARVSMPITTSQEIRYKPCV